MTVYQFPDIDGSENTITPLANTRAYLADSGAIQTDDNGGSRLKCRINMPPLQDSNARLVQSLLNRLNGQEHRLAIRDHSYQGPGGSLAVSELNPAFLAANYATTSWLTQSTITQGLRYKRQKNDANGHAVVPTADRTVEVGLSYSLKNALLTYTQKPARGRRLYATPTGGSGGDLLDDGSSNIESGVYVGGFTAPVTGVRAGWADNSLSGTAYSVVDHHGCSMARCLLVDNGVNFLTESNTFDDADWTKGGSTITANASNDYENQATADALVEDSSTGVHRVLQTYTRASATEFWTGSVVIEADTQRRIALRVDDGGANGALAYFDATSGSITGAASNLGTATFSFATIHNIGDGLYRCRLSVRLPASTSAQLHVFLCDGASNTTSYTGNGSSRLFISDAQLQRGGQLGRITRTTTATNSGSSQTGSQIWLKGLNNAEDGQMLAGDQMEIAGQLVYLLDDLDGDVSGVGLANVFPPIRVGPSDEEAAVLHKPEGRFILASNENSYRNRLAGFRAFTLDLIEDIAV